MFALKKFALVLVSIVVMGLAFASTRLIWSARAANPECANIAISLSPSLSTYQPGQAITITVSGVTPANDTEVWLHVIRSTASTSATPTNWTQIGVWPASQSQYVASWLPPNTLPGPMPYNISNNQEFIIAFTLYDTQNNQFVCSGSPDPGPMPTHPEITNALCENCRKIVITRQNPTGTVVPMANYWNIQPGYSITYRVTRHDNPIDDNGTPVPSDSVFTTRMEYEAPVKICSDISVIPQRFTKNSPWAYWSPAKPQPADRTDLWTRGNANLRFFLTVPQYNYSSWNSSLIGAYGHKIYEGNGDFEIGYLKGSLTRTLIHTSRNHENYYYPPYLLSYSTGPLSGQDSFTRLDTLYSYPITDSQTTICVTQPNLSEDHSWHMRMKLLTDTDLRGEFNTLLDYYGNSKKIYVLTYFEGGGYSNHQAAFREDWYLMEDVGLVGIDQAGWEQDDDATRQAYLNAQFMTDSAAPSHIKVRAERAYLGGALQLTAISPGTTFPLTINSSTGGCYTVGIHSTTPGGAMPYDGLLEQNLGSTPGLWVSAQPGNPPLRAENGQVTACMPAGFPPGTYAVSLRPYIMDSQGFAPVELISTNESMLAYDAFPWSDNQLVVNVVSAEYKLYLPLSVNDTP